MSTKKLGFCTSHEVSICRILFNTENRFTKSMSSCSDTETSESTALTVPINFLAALTIVLGQSPDSGKVNCPHLPRAICTHSRKEHTKLSSKHCPGRQFKFSSIRDSRYSVEEQICNTCQPATVFRTSPHTKPD